MSTYDPTTYFNFNLIPPRPKEEIEELQERDNSILYGFLLIFVAVFVYFSLIMLDFFLVAPKVDQSENLLAQRENTIDQFSNTRLQYGELIIKANAISEYLQKDIKIQEFMNVSEDLLSNFENAQITNYTRNEKDGSFTIRFKTNSITTPVELLELAQEFEEIQNFRVDNITKYANDGGRLTVSINFQMTAQDG